MTDLILYNGTIITQDADAPVVEALAVRDGRVLATGSSDDIMRLTTPDTVKQNLDGAVILPGFTDAHVHLELTSRQLTSVDLYEVPDVDTALQRIRQARTQRDASAQSEWLTGHGWAQGLWPDAQFPTATQIDQVCADIPCYFSAKSAHAAWVNSTAMRIAGIDAQTPDPPGGALVRDASGNPTGILLEAPAMNLVLRHIPASTPSQVADAIALAQQAMLRTGITSIHDFDDPSCLHALQLLRERDELQFRVVKQINQNYLEPVIASGLRQGFGDDWLRLGNLKMFADGALGPRTALMLAPYNGEPDNTGIGLVSTEEMTRSAVRATEHGFATSIHAIGDLAVRHVLDAFTAVRRYEQQHGIPADSRRHRVEHVQTIHPDDVQRFAELNLIASMQPNHATSDWQVAMQLWGEERCEHAYNPRQFIDRGVPVAFGSDTPVERFAPLVNIRAAVTRQTIDNQPPGGWYPQARISIEEAIAGFTTGPAYAAGMEHRLGRLAPGYWADCVQLSHNPFTVPPAQLGAIDVLGTMTAGVWRFGPHA